MDRATMIECYERASAADDFETMRSFRHPEWQMTWPQSGEIVVGHKNYVTMRTNRPEGAARGLSRLAMADRRPLVVGGDHPLRRWLPLARRLDL